MQRERCWLAMSSVINSRDLGVTSKNDKVGIMEAEPQCSNLEITFERQLDSTSATDSAQEEPLRIENSRGLDQEGLMRVQQTCNDQNKQIDQEITPSGSNNHETVKSDSLILETDLPLQEKQCFEAAEADVPEQNKEVSDTSARNGEENSNDNLQQLEKDTPVTTCKQESSSVTQQDVDEQTEGVSHSKLNDHMEKSNESELEKDTPMEAEDQLYDYLLSPNSDQHQISPCNVNAYSIPGIMRNKNIYPNVTFLDILVISP